MEEIISRIMESLDFGLIFCINIISYFVIKLIDEISKKYTPKLIKILITFIVGFITCFVVYKMSNEPDFIKIFYSFFFSLLSYDYIFKPILKKFKFSYKDKEEQKEEEENI